MPATAATADALPQGTRTVFDAALGRTVEAPVIERDTFTLGQRISGPAIITEDETTIIVPSSRSASVQADGCIDLQVKG
jgi:N-methylhydantoinase A